MTALTDAEWDDLRSENMYDTEESVRRYVDRLIADRMAMAWDEGWNGNDDRMRSFDNPYRESPPTSDRPKWVDLFGIAPDWTGDQSVDEFLEEQRGEA